MVLHFQCGRRVFRLLMNHQLFSVNESLVTGIISKAQTSGVRSDSLLLT